MSAIFIGSRLTIARMLMGWSQKYLAERVGVTPATVSFLERDLRQPTPSLLRNLSSVLDFEPHFFFKHAPDILSSHNSSFRSQRSTTKSQRNRLFAYGTLLGELISLLKSRLQLPPYSVPRFSVSSDEDIEEAAETCRRHWSLTEDSPILNGLRVLEHAGVVTGAIECGTYKIDAFSSFAEPCFVVFCLDKANPSRMRFSIFHELGHLALHQEFESLGQDKENEANRFASAFLMPRKSFSREFLMHPLQWSYMFELKKRWKVSLAAIVKRASDLGLIDKVQTSRACAYMRKKGWARGEPFEPEQECPELLPAALEAVQTSQGLKLQQVATELGWTSSVMNRVTTVDFQPPDNGGNVTSLCEYRNARA